MNTNFIRAPKYCGRRDGFVFKRRRKEEASTSAKAHKAPRVEEVPAREHDGYRGGARVQEEPEEVGAAYVSSKRQDRGRRASFITEETSWDYFSNFCSRYLSSSRKFE